MVRYKKSDGKYDYGYSSFSYTIGRKDGSYYSGSPEDIYRTEIDFDLSQIPSNAIISSANLVLSMNFNNAECKFKITQTNGTGSYDVLWNDIANSTVFKESQPYGSYSYDIKNLLEQSINSKHLYFGFMSQNESWNNSEATMDVSVQVQYTVPNVYVNVTADNNFIASDNTHGKIKVNSSDKTAPYPFSATTGQTSINLEAIPNQVDKDGYVRVWNDYKPNNKSKWIKYDSENNQQQIENNFAKTYTITSVAETDAGAKYEANLRKIYNVHISEKSEFDGTVTVQNVASTVEGNSVSISAPASKTVNGRTYNFAGWEQNANGVFTPTDNQTYSFPALYKMVNKSGYPMTFSKNNKRKVIKDNSGHLHLVYESMDHIWYEKSINNGQSWEIQNGGKPLSFLDGRNPSIDYFFHSSTGKNVIAIAYNDFQDVKLKIFVDGIMKKDLVVMHYSSYSADDYSPSVTCPGDANIMVFVSDYGIAYRRGVYEVFQDNFTWKNADMVYLNEPSLEYHKNLAVASIISGTTLTSHLVWQEQASYSSKIKYMNLSGSYQATTLTESAIEEVSAGAPFSYQQDPSITILNGKPYVSWLAHAGYGISNSAAMCKSRSAQNSWSSFLAKYGSYINSPSINKTNDGKIILVWSEENGAKTYSHTNGSIKLLSAQGKYIQATNGSSLITANAIVFNNSAVPYSFITVNDIATQTGQSTDKVLADSDPSKVIITEGRTAVIIKDSASFLFNIKNIKVDGQNVTFKSLNDTAVVNTFEKMNQYIVSNPFAITDNSEFYVSASYFTTDSLKALAVLSKDGKIEVKAELIDAATGKSISSFNKKVFSSNYLFRNIDNSFKINTNGVGNKSVYIKLNINTNLDNCEVNIIRNYYNDVEGEVSVNSSVNLNEIELVTSYDLLTNYPNPFNPSTNISYQMPEAGLVTLKVFDMLGQEVATIVNEVKDAGKHSAVFNASHLSSGTYIYEIKVNDFRKTQKMMLVK